MADFQYPEDILKYRQAQVRRLLKGLPGIAALGALLLAALTCFYSVGTDEAGVVLRFGKYVRTTMPGLHVKMPFLIERAIPIKVKRIFKEEFGFRSDAGMARRGGGFTGEEALMLTGDLNVLEIRWIVQFQIKDPVRFLFRVRDQQDTIRDLSEAVMRRVVGDYSVDEVLTTKRAEIDVEAQHELQRILDSYDAGLQIVTLKLQDVTPPDRVQPAFNEVNEAKQEKERTINQAWETYNRAIPKAKGEAERTIREAEGYAVDVVNRAKGEAHRFLATWEAYRLAPAVTKKRLYLETLSDVLAQAKQKYIIDPSQQALLPLLHLQPKGD
ncbi:MAG: FtsH protease activity modulator HflK [Candidatus Omnitrophica bacterium]|nr:FtsH protease activity modulator HflK [Candidatus Omnitrophota bacterium]